jgi:hypothetical protein
MTNNGLRSWFEFHVKFLVITIIFSIILSSEKIKISSWLRHYATSRKVTDWSPDDVDSFNWFNPSSRIVALGSTQPLTEMSTRNLPAGKGRSAHKADNLTAVCETIVQMMWEPRHLTYILALTAFYRDSFTFFIRLNLVPKGQNVNENASMQKTRLSLFACLVMV